MGTDTDNILENLARVRAEIEILSRTDDSTISAQWAQLIRELLALRQRELAKLESNIRAMSLDRSQVELPERDLKVIRLQAKHRINAHLVAGGRDAQGLRVPTVLNGWFGTHSVYQAARAERLHHRVARWDAHTQRVADSERVAARRKRKNKARKERRVCK